MDEKLENTLELNGNYIFSFVNSIGAITFGTTKKKPF